MVFELKFADIGEGVHEGEILEWHVKEGDTVKVEALLVEINTEKVNAQITAPVAGKIVSIKHKEGNVVKVGDILVTIDTDSSGSSKKESAAPAQKAEEKDDSLFTPAAPFKRIAKQTPTATVTNSGKVLASPAVRHRAKQSGVDLRQVPGSGPAGRITRQDLAQYLSNGGSSARPAATVTRPVRKKLDIVPGGETRIPLKGVRKTIAASMRKSKDTAAHYTYFEEVDMTALRDLRESLKPMMQETGVKLSYPALVMKCMIPALRKFPIMNSSLDEEANEIVVKDYFNIGISVDTDDGLIVPVVKNVEQKDLWQVGLEINELADKARNGKLTLDDVTGGTITITSIGNIGGLMATPIIKTPEVAILGLMQAKLKPVVIEKNGAPEIAIRYMMNLSLSLDHRIVDGAIGARFIRELIRYMENPALAWIEEAS